MTALPPATDYTDSGITQGQKKTFMSSVRSYLSGLLGDTGTQATALTTLGALLNGSVALTGATTVGAAHRGKVLECTGTWTLAIEALGTLGAGFAFAAHNSSSGSITVNPNLSEPINGASTLVLGPFESCAIVANADATAWIAVFLGGSGNTGQVAPYAMSTAPAGWLKANGAAVSRTSYAALFAAIGTTFGAGDGSTTFNLPDLRSEFIRGWDDGRGVDSGRVFGSAQGGAIESHSHTVPVTTSSAVGEGAEITASAPTLSMTTKSTNATGGSETRPRNVALLFCIKY